MAFSLRLVAATQPEEVWKEMNRIGVSPEGLELMIGKGEFIIVKVGNIPAPAASILKQEMLAKGARWPWGKKWPICGRGRGKPLSWVPVPSTGVY